MITSPNTETAETPTTCAVIAFARDHNAATQLLTHELRRARRLNCHRCPDGPNCKALTTLENELLRDITATTKRQNATPTTPPRKRGGQPGNTNALTHGFYSRQFQNLEIEDLDTALANGLTDEIQMLRVVTRRTLALAEGAPNIDTAIATLNALGAASIRLASLLRTQTQLGAETSDTATALAEALANVVADLCLTT